MRISDWSSDVCSSDLGVGQDAGGEVALLVEHGVVGQQALVVAAHHLAVDAHGGGVAQVAVGVDEAHHRGAPAGARRDVVQHLTVGAHRSEEHTSELKSLMRISSAVFCFKKKKN